MNTTTTNSCDLPEEIAARYGIITTPLYINFGLEDYLDRLDLSHKAFFAQLPDCDSPRTTVVPGPQMILDAYVRLADEEVTEILSVQISRSLSAVVDTAHLVAREVSTPVTNFDSGTLRLGTDLFMWAAPIAAASGKRNVGAHRRPR